MTVTRSHENPILKPEPNHQWEKEATFNESVSLQEGVYHLVYRALSEPVSRSGLNVELSSIGYAKSTDGVHFAERKQLIAPEEHWEKFGCEDPRITYFEGTYYIFYTALSTYPFSPEGIKIGVALSKDLTKIDEKHPVTFFNAKAMALFPQRINGKIAALLTPHTDMPPAKIALAFFDKEEDIWSLAYWQAWYSSINSHIIPLLRTLTDQVELGSPPVKTEKGWLVLYSYIQNYYTPQRTFGIEAVLLDFSNPLAVIGRTTKPLLIPEEPYELQGKVPNVVFPSGAVVTDNTLMIYYGAADTSCCLATVPLSELFADMTNPPLKEHTHQQLDRKLTRFPNNPIIEPIGELAWESRATFNPGAILLNNKVHILYRAMSQDNTSVIGYACSSDGYHIDERLREPIYTPKENFERKTVYAGNSGCEDPRLTKIGDFMYMAYTAFDGTNPPRVALTSIAVSDFLERNWQWKRPILISPPGTDDKNTCILPRQIGGKYLFLHRIGSSIWIDYVSDLTFTQNRWLGGKILAEPRKDKWDNQKIGISTPPIETEKGWLLLYHGVQTPGTIYRTGALLLDLESPDHVLARTEDPIFEPEMEYEKVGEVPNVVFPCGAAVINDMLFVYYGGADKVVGGATMPLKKLLELLL